jgi:hypothetical protein
MARLMKLPTEDEQDAGNLRKGVFGPYVQKTLEQVFGQPDPVDESSEEEDELPVDAVDGEIPPNRNTVSPVQTAPNAESVRLEKLVQETEQKAALAVKNLSNWAYSKVQPAARAVSDKMRRVFTQRPNIPYGAYVSGTVNENGEVSIKDENGSDVVISKQVVRFVQLAPYDIIISKDGFPYFADIVVFGHIDGSALLVSLPTCSWEPVNNFYHLSIEAGSRLTGVKSKRAYKPKKASSGARRANIRGRMASFKTRKSQASGKMIPIVKVWNSRSMRWDYFEFDSWEEYNQHLENIEDDPDYQHPRNREALVELHRYNELLELNSGLLHFEQVSDSEDYNEYDDYNGFDGGEAEYYEAFLIPARKGDIGAESGRSVSSVPPIASPPAKPKKGKKGKNKKAAVIAVPESALAHSTPSDPKIADTCALLLWFHEETTGEDELINHITLYKRGGACAGLTTRHGLYPANAKGYYFVTLSNCARYSEGGDLERDTPPPVDKRLRVRPNATFGELVRFTPDSAQVQQLTKDHKLAKSPAGGFGFAWALVNAQAPSVSLPSVGQLPTGQNTFIWVALPGLGKVFTGNVVQHKLKSALPTDHGIKQVTAEFFSHKASTYINKGGCGLPIFNESSQLVGIHCAGTSKNPNGANWGAYVHESLQGMSSTSAGNSGAGSLNF